MLRGLPLNVPPEITRGAPEVGSSSSMTARRPPTAPIGSPPPMILPKVVRSGSPPYLAWAPPWATRKLITSS